ncbi:WD repeat-containing protein 87-like [Ruditapes philippinarum]|uniref:WD repeat-containing protein 87-like n=1 Tax=Ruditapes philippinarum TaxID=129788 RepID=UPI00295C2D58|nr:WD repeat-containing protein 87-like [Ruditapes philippinarum]
MKQFDTIARWDKLKSWRVLSDEIEDKLKAAEKSDHGMTLDIGPQLLYTLRHPSSLKCMHHSSSKLGEMFTCHYNKGAVQGVRVWLVETKDKEGACKNKGFEIDCEILCMTYVSKHRVYLVFSSDLTLRVFTDARSNFVEIDRVTCMATILCLIYNKWEDEVYAGGAGFIEEWKVVGAEHAASVVPGKKFFTDLTINDWIRNIKILKENNHIIAQHGNGLCVINFKTRKQMHRLPNRHDGPLTCCCYYHPNDFLITGGSDGKIKVFNGTAFNLLHAFIGHNGLISDIQPQIKDALLFSSSHDGTVRIWRVDSMQLFMSLDIGEKVYHMALLSNTEFYFYTEKNIMIYSCHQFYEFFAPVESETKRLMCCRAKDRPSRILASTEDGSVRLFSPITGLTLTIIYPMPSFQVLMSFAYDIHQEKLHTVLTGGKVIVYNTATNPCKAVELWVPKTEDEHVNILLLVTVEFPCEDGTDVDNLVFAGLKNGQILLCDAVVCSMEDPVQAHEGSIVCLQNCLHSPDTGHFGSSDTVGVIISGGTDKYVKIWNLQIISDDRRPIINLCQVLKIYLPSVPLHISMYSTNVWVATQTVSKKGHNSCKLVMYKLIQMGSSKTMASKQLLQKKFVLIAHQVTHHEDEDHTGEVSVGKDAKGGKYKQNSSEVNLS